MNEFGIGIGIGIGFGVGENSTVDKIPRQKLMRTSFARYILSVGGTKLVRV